MKFLFYISKKYSLPIVEPIAEYLNSTGHQYSFFVSRKVRADFPEDHQNDNILTDLNEAIHFNADFVLVPGNFVDFRIPGIKVQIFHGLGVEKEAHYKIRHFFDCYCTSGPFVTKKFLELQSKHKYFKVFETGWPKVDHILNFPKEKLKAVDLPVKKKIILFAPTHSSRMESATDLMKVIPEIIRDDEYWLVKFHELMNKDLVTNFKNRLQKKAHFIDDNDITAYLHAADVLISDTSSVLYEFMLLDKPVITYKTKSRSDKGIDLTNPETLRDVIDWSLKNPAEHKENRRKHIDQINPYLDGNVSQRLIETIIKNKSILEKIRKPRNLFRKWQILYHAKFKQGYLR